MHASLDHLVVAADRLERGIDAIEDTLGVRPVVGGKHPRQGTHNALLRLGEDRYLEIIAVDPNAAPPRQPRWFGLDSPIVRDAIADSPRLLTWVARTDSLAESMAMCDRDLGEVWTMCRGEFRWRITLTPDGVPVEGGMLPSLIEWDSLRHPAHTLPESGCDLVRLEGTHRDPGSLCATLGTLGLNSALTITQSGDNNAGLRAHIRTPKGKIVLGAN